MQKKNLQKSKIQMCKQENGCRQKPATKKQAKGNTKEVIQKLNTK